MPDANIAPQKRTQQETLFAAEQQPIQDETTYRLTHLEVFNWGPFSGLHRADFDLGGTAIIGPTGSGKTTLIDALMTLLVAQPRYNLASTGGVESDRSLVSYVRGVIGGDGSGGNAEVSRGGKTITGICATYESQQDTEEPEIMRLGGLLWTEGPSDSPSDLKRRWIFSLAGDQTLGHWLEVLHENGARGISKLGREIAKLRVFDSKRAYLTHVRKFFDVSENAFTLLNRAAGLKQLNSIDEIFRDLVLDDRTAFDRALEVAAEFDNLAEIHAELETAKNQHQSLLPIQTEFDALKKLNEKTAALETLKRILPTYFAIRCQAAWAAELERIKTQLEKANTRLAARQQDLAIQQTKTDTLKESYLKLGGNVIGELEKTIEVLRRSVADRTKHADDYRRLMRSFDLSEELTSTSLATNQTILKRRRDEVQTARDAQEEQTLSVLASGQTQNKEFAELSESLRKVKQRPASNIPPRFGDFRSELAAELQLSEDDLPFLAELVEVKADQSAWRGAIERALGAERLRVLVPDEQLDAALRWVNSRNNRLHVRLQRARTDEPPEKFFDDGYARKLNYKPHPLVGTAKWLIGGRDLHCVSSPERLRTTEHGLTVEGMMSGRAGRFDKQDRRRLDEDWMTGFDNQAQLKILVEKLITLQASIEQCESDARRERSKLKEIDERLILIDQLLSLEFATIDLPSATAELESSESRLRSLLDPDSDASRAKAEYEAERKKLDAIADDVSKMQTEIAVFSRDADEADKQRVRAESRAGSGLLPEETALADRQLTIDPAASAADLDDIERHYVKLVDDKLHKSHEKVQDQQQRLIRLMAAAKQVDTGALVETGTEISDIPDYLDRLRVLSEEALPDKQKRFREYLNQSSDQGVTQMLAGIEEEVDAIQQRITELNHTLAEVDFRSGRFLQLLPQKIRHERLRALETAMRKVRSSALKDDEGVSHYKSLRELVEILRAAADNRRQLGSKALLDPRYRLQFFVVEVDRKTGNRSQPRTGSQSGSGGEKELMASHILTASLSYALCPTEASRPLYGTVILDEAFSKSSPSAAGRIIEALTIFHLHPIFVTPNKEIGLLKKHTRRVICVQRRGTCSTLASISWEVLEQLAGPDRLAGPA